MRSSARGGEVDVLSSTGETGACCDLRSLLSCADALNSGSSMMAVRSALRPTIKLNLWLRNRPLPGARRLSERRLMLLPVLLLSERGYDGTPFNASVRPKLVSLLYYPPLGLVATLKAILFG